jgi:uncharacterized ubiquitin-like protein YukD
MKSEFTITIDDTYCEYQYVLNLPDHIAIYDIIDIVCDRLNIETPEGKFMKKPTTKAGKAAKVAKTMREYKAGKLKAGIDPKGPKKAPMAKSRKQAVAIAMSQAGMKKKK